MKLENKMNIIFNKVEKWINISKLKMNADQTKYMIIRGVRKEVKGNIILKCLDGTELERVKTTKYLEVIINDRLQFNYHCDYMLRKIRKKRASQIELITIIYRYILGV